MTVYRDLGVVLRTHRLGEADRIVVLLTEQHGKVRAVAKGVRKTRSRLGGRLEPLSHVRLLMFRGRGELDTVTQAELVDHFRPLRDDLDRMTKAMALVEVVDQSTMDREPDPRRFQMLVGALRTLAERDSPVLVPAFFLKLLAADGLRPELEACVGCGRADALVAIDPDGGGVVCRSCRVGRPVPVGPEGLDLLRRILGGDLLGALAAAPSAATHDVDVVATRLMEQHTERRVRSVAVFGQG